MKAHSNTAAYRKSAIYIETEIKESGKEILGLKISNELKKSVKK